MGNVLVVFKVLPEGLESNLDGISAALKKTGIGRFNSLEKEPIAFGLFALKPSYVIGDEGGVLETLEEKIKGISGVRSAEVVDISLV